MAFFGRAPLVGKLESAAERQRRRLMVTPLWLQCGRIPIDSRGSEVMIADRMNGS